MNMPVFARVDRDLFDDMTVDYRQLLRESTSSMLSV